MKPLLLLLYVFLSMWAMFEVVVWLVPLAGAALAAYPVFAASLAIFAAAIILSLWVVSILKMSEIIEEH